MDSSRDNYRLQNTLSLVVDQSLLGTANADCRRRQVIAFSDPSDALNWQAPKLRDANGHDLTTVVSKAFNETCQHRS